MKGASFSKRVGFAIAGWHVVWRRERSFRTQCVAGAAAMAVLLAAPSPIWIAVVTLAIGLVLALESANAALEYLADAVHPQFATEIGRAKDAAAGSVLNASSAALLVEAAFLYSAFRSG